MFYIIPAWYQKNTFSENEQIWYTRRMRSEFDDSVKLMQLLHRKGDIPYQLLLLSYAPNFRHFLHRQGVYRAPYWSIFDAMQGITRTKAAVLSYRNIAWPEGVEFVSSPYALHAMLRGEKYAQVEFGEDGNPIQISIFSAGRKVRTNYYDDRGFVSSSVVYENEKEVFQDFLNEKGERKFRYFFADDHVEICEEEGAYRIEVGQSSKQIPFAKKTYAHMDELLYEVLSHYLSYTKRDDIFCEAMHERQFSLLAKALQGKKRILSFFGTRFPADKDKARLEDILSADFIVTSEKRQVEEWKRLSGFQIKNIVDISPFDTRVDKGISEQVAVQKILVPVDDLPREDYARLVALLAEYMEEHPKARTHLFTRYNNHDRPDYLMRILKEDLAKVNRDITFASQIRRDQLDIIPDEDQEEKQRFFVEQCVSELEASRCLREQRVILDVRDRLDTFLQVSAISMGIPQIVCKENEFALPGKNATRVDKMEDIPTALNYYLNEMKHWNKARISAYELGKLYTTDVLLAKWKKVIEIVGNR